MKLPQCANPISLNKQGILGMNRRNIDYISCYNDRQHFPNVDDKLKTKRIAQQAGVSVPELIMVIHTQREADSIAEQLTGINQFVFKPAQGSGGKGILIILSREEGLFVKSNGEKLSIHDLVRHLSNIISGLYSLGGRTDVAIMETLVNFDPVFNDLSYEGVPDIRLIVFRGYPVMGMLRLATRASDGKANLHQGAIGIGLDMAVGESIGAVQYNRPIQKHPDSGASLSGISIPHWRTLLLLAARCYEASKLGYLGADLVLDKARGPLLLELNARPGLTIQVANKSGLLPRLRKIEQIEIPASDPQQRVDYAIQQFSKRGKSADLFAQD
ncbi:MAG: alpha-L-glutamate ligase-like protein [Pseudomonadales bacterium]|nr:alpha-L-glutamate ligase-like protein [Pseudomonadales bacterium]